MPDKSIFKIWKISHDDRLFDDGEIDQFLKKKKVLVSHLDFRNRMQVGDYFYLCHGKERFSLFGKIVSEAKPAEEKTGWYERNYRKIGRAVHMPDGKGSNKDWGIASNSVFALIPANEHSEFETEILRPVFELSLDTIPTISEISSINKLVDALQKLSDKGAIQRMATPDASILPKGLNQIYYGPTGTGKTYRMSQLKSRFVTIDEELSKEILPSSHLNRRYEFVTFHPSYSYEDFVEGVRPVVRENEKDGSREIHHEVQPGVFKSICQRAEQDGDKDYAIFIDEINRGDIPQIFGEMLTLIETDKRITPRSNQQSVLDLMKDRHQDKGLRIRLPYSGEEFGVPSNLYIIGSMNSADSFNHMIDTAVRRRFFFEEMMPQSALLNKMDKEEPSDQYKLEVEENPEQNHKDDLIVEGVNMRRLLTRINQRIEYLLNRDYTVGHAYFMSLHPKSKVRDLKDIFESRIIPLLQDYFNNDWKRIRWVLADNQVKEKENQFIIEREEYDFESLFGKVEEATGSDSENRVYRLNSEAMNRFECYRKIYEVV